MTNKEAIEILKHERDNDIFVKTEHRENIHRAYDLAIKALEVADKVEKASKRIGSRYYGPDICSKCAHRNDLMSKVREEPSIFCEHWKLRVNSFDHCSKFEEVKHDKTQYNHPGI